MLSTSSVVAKNALDAIELAFRCLIQECGIPDADHPLKVLASELTVYYGAPDPRTQAGYGCRSMTEELSRRLGKTVTYERAGRRVTNAVWMIT